MTTRGLHPHHDPHTLAIAFLFQNSTVNVLIKHSNVEYWGGGNNTKKAPILISSDETGSKQEKDRKEKIQGLMTRRVQLLIRLCKTQLAHSTETGMMTACYSELRVRRTNKIHARSAA